MMQRIDHMSQQRLNLRAIALQQLGRFSSYNTILFSALLIWATALLGAIITSIMIGIPTYEPIMLVGGAMILVLLIILELVSIDLGDGLLLSPAPALMIAGFAMTTWNVLIPAVIIGTLVPGIIRKRMRFAITEAGGRTLAVALLAPVYMLAHPGGMYSLNTWHGLIGMLVMGSSIYLIESLTSAAHQFGPLLQRCLHVLRKMRWYALATLPIGGLLGQLWVVGPLAFIPGLVTLALLQHLFRAQIRLELTSQAFQKLATQHSERGERLEHLQSLTTSMIGTLDMQEMLHMLCIRLAALMNAPHGWIVILNRDRSLSLMASHNIGVSQDTNGQALVNANSYYALMQRGRVVIITDEKRHNLMPVTAMRDSVNWPTLLAIPLVAEKQVLGLVCLAFEQLRGLDSEEQRVLSAFAHQTAITLENARLFEELRTKQLELIESSKLAAVGTFAAGIAHEFNNLLSSMLGHAELSQSSDQVEEKDHALEVVLQACRRGRSITRGLLSFARHHDNQRTLADISNAVDETLRLVEIDLRKCSIEVVRDYEPLPSTICDIGHISQVVLNLITNARDAMKPDGGTLTIRLRHYENEIELRIEDTGCGIAPDMLDKIFEPFVTTKGVPDGSHTSGTGLGLSVSCGIIKDHGGSIDAESTPGQGTAMIVRLPIVLDFPA